MPITLSDSRNRHETACKFYFPKSIGEITDKLSLGCQTPSGVASKAYPSLPHGSIELYSQSL